MRKPTRRLVQIMLSEAEIAAVDAWGEARGLVTRTATLRSMLAIVLKQDRERKVEKLRAPVPGGIDDDEDI